MIILEVSEATREVQWNVTSGMVAFMYLSFAVAGAVFVAGFWRRVRIWRTGRPEYRSDRPLLRMRRVVSEVLGHRALLKHRIAGIMHALIFFGFVVLFIATLVVFVHHELGVPIMRGRFYLYFQSLTANVFGLAAMVGVAIAAWRRYLVRLPQLERGRLWDAALLVILFLILFSGFVISGLRIVVTDDPWALWRPFSYGTGLALEWLVSDREALRSGHAATWVVHVALWHGLLAVTPFTKMFHIVSSSLNIYFENLDQTGTMEPIDFEGTDPEPVFGVGSALDLTWKQLLDLDACTECGRCEAVCPAWAVGKPLSPKRVILDSRDHVREHQGALREVARARGRGDQDRVEELRRGLPPLAGGVIRTETLWACTTCRACEEACPVSIEHVRLIVQMRQHLAMEEAEVPEGVAQMAEGLESRGSPFRGMGLDRMAWVRARTETEAGSGDDD